MLTYGGIFTRLKHRHCGRTRPQRRHSSNVSGQSASLQLETCACGDPGHCRCRCCAVAHRRLPPSSPLQQSQWLGLPVVAVVAPPLQLWLLLSRGIVCAVTGCAGAAGLATLRRYTADWLRCSHDDSCHPVIAVFVLHLRNCAVGTRSQARRVPNDIVRARMTHSTRIETASIACLASARQNIQIPRSKLSGVLIHCSGIE